MPEIKPINGTKGWGVLITSIIISFFGSGGGVFFYMQNLGADQLQQIARPDPATGTELRAIKNELHYHLQNHPDIVNRFDRRLTRLETKVDILLERLK